MSFREKYKDYKTRFKETTRRVFGGKASSVPPTNSVPDLQSPSPSVTPTFGSLTVPAVTDPVARPTSAPPTSAQLTGPNEPLLSTSIPPATSPLPQTPAILAPSFSTPTAPKDRSPETDTSKSVQPTSSIPDPQSPYLNTVPAPSTPAVPAVTDPVTEPVSAPSTGAQSTGPNEPLSSTRSSPLTGTLPQTPAVSAPSSSTPVPPKDQTPEADTAQSLEPTKSVPDHAISSSSTFPAPSSLIVPAVAEPVTRPTSAPLGSAQLTGPNEPLPSTGVPPATSPLSRAAVSDPLSSPRPAPATPNVRSPNANPSRSGLEPFQVLTTASSLLGPLQSMVNDLTEFFEVYKDAVAADSDFAALKAELKKLLDTLNSSFTSDAPPIIAECVGDLCRSINEELDKISGRDKGGVRRRLWEANKDLDKARACRDQIRGHVDTATLKIVGGHGKILTQHHQSLDEHAKRLDEQARIVEEQARLAEEQARFAEEQARSAKEQEKLIKEEAIENRLKALSPSSAAFYKSSEAATLLRRECTPNTRKQVISSLDEWRRDSKQGNIFWMNGMAGTGKTTIANTLCATLKTEHKLGASFFCSRQLPECRRVKLILPTIAYQLARFSRPFRDALSQALESDPDLRTKDLPSQLNGLIIAPLRKISEPLPIDLVVVIDALDECEDRAGVEEMLGVFVTHASDLPIKVFISSRPEEEIRKQIGRTESQVVLHELDKEIVQEDIDTYLREELKGTSLSDDQLTELVKRAGVLFIYAATVVRFVKEKNSASGQRQRLKIVLSASTHENKIDELYSAVLASAFSNPKLLDPEKAQMRDILHTVVCAQEPLTVDALAVLLQLDDGDLVLDALEPLWSVLHVSGSGGTSLVTTLHASFPDYMLDTQRSNIYSCNATSHHGQLAELCFKRIEGNDRQFNICELESSYVFDDQVPELDERVKRSIPLDLSYACQYWAVHLELGGSSPGHMPLLENFLSKRLLLWMEVLNLKKRMNVGAVLLEKARKWCTNQDGPEATQGLIHDAWRFTTTFAANPVSRSTPHLYVSMLPFWPNSKLINDCYVKRAGGLAEVGGSGMTRRQLVLLGVFPVGGHVSSVAFSPDGTRIICGCGDGIIGVWDAQSGKAVLGPRTGHTQQVNSVACSPDGLRIASGSYDSTIRVWDARSGKMTMKPLEGHTDWVLSVAFSPDSTRIVSGSKDKTIRVWDSQTGRRLEPLKGHIRTASSLAYSPDGRRIVSCSSDGIIRVWDLNGQELPRLLSADRLGVNMVAFSPDSSRIVSGSRDKMIQVWNAQTGESILGPLKRHTHPVNAVAYSPDGMHIVSGSDDKTIRMWDARSGQVVLGPLEGHTERVTSVAFSPDGMRIVSGSSDQTIRVWDAQSREVSLGPFDGHTESVNSVAFAPDGRRFASGSSDRTIRVWDVQSGEMVLGPLEGHTELVSSVAFSPDGTRIASGSWDETIRVWDSQNGKLALQPLKGHASWVRSVVFSPDNTRIVSGSHNNQIRVWDVCSGDMVLGPLEGHTRLVYSVAVSLDGRWIVSGSGDRTIRVWDAQNGRALLGPLEGHTGDVNSVALSPDSTRIVSGSDDKTIRVWNAQTGQMVLEPLEGHTHWVASVAFSPNGMYIVSGSYDKTIRVWSAQTGELVLGPLHSHIRGVLSTSFSPDSTHIVSGSRDKTIRVWRLPSLPPTDDSTPCSPADPSASHSGADPQIHQPAPFCQASSSVTFPRAPDEDGWLVDDDQHLWLWVPTDLRNSIAMLHNTLVISRQGSVRTNFDGANMGESWAQCYTPA